MMEEQRANGNAAASLVQQFVEAGFVQQDEDGSFIVPGDDEQRRFKPFGNE